MFKLAPRIARLVDWLLYVTFSPIMRHFVVLSVNDAADAIKKTERLRREGFRVSFDVMVEDVGDNMLIAKVRRFYDDLLREMHDGGYGNIVIKPTSLGLDASVEIPNVTDGRFAKQLRSLLLAVAARNEAHGKTFIEIEIDAESTKTIARTFLVITHLSNEFPHLRHLLRIAVPMHIRDLPKLTRYHRLLDHPVRIVKGAGVYSEEEGRLVDTATIERRFEEYFLECLARKKHPFLATMHDERLLRRVLLSAENRGVEKSEFAIQMLYGLWAGLGRRLIAEGYTVCVYVPIVLPWCNGASNGYVQRRVSIFRRLFWKWLTACFHGQ